MPNSATRKTTASVRQREMWTAHPPVQAGTPALVGVGFHRLTWAPPSAAGQQRPPPGSRGPRHRGAVCAVCCSPGSSGGSVRLLVLPGGQPVPWAASDGSAPGARGLLSWAFSGASSLPAIPIQGGKEGGRGEKTWMGERNIHPLPPTHALTGDQTHPRRVPRPRTEAGPSPFSGHPLPDA